MHHYKCMHVKWFVVRDVPNFIKSHYFYSIWLEIGLINDAFGYRLNATFLIHFTTLRFIIYFCCCFSHISSFNSIHRTTCISQHLIYIERDRLRRTHFFSFKIKSKRSLFSTAQNWSGGFTTMPHHRVCISFYLIEIRSQLSRLIGWNVQINGTCNSISWCVNNDNLFDIW